MMKLTQASEAAEFWTAFVCKSLGVPDSWSVYGFAFALFMVWTLTKDKDCQISKENTLYYRLLKGLREWK